MPNLSQNGQVGAEIEVTPEMVEAGTEFVMGFFAAEWGGRKGISRDEAAAVAQGVLAVVGVQCEPASKRQ